MAKTTARRYAVKKILIIALVFVALLIGSTGYMYWSYRNSERIGRDKFTQALTEVEAEDSNPKHYICIGMLDDYSYYELSSKTITEIKSLIVKSAGVC